jgi:hypothetical protein
MRYIFSLRADTLNSDENDDLTVYGIDVTDSSGKMLRSVPDIFTDFEKASDFAELCNNMDIPLDYLDYIIEDILSSH